MTWIKKQSDDSFKSYNFIAPDGPSASEDVLFPLGEVQSPDYEATLAVAIKQMATFLQPEELEGALTINLTIDDQVTKGALLLIKLDAGDTERAVTLGTGFDSDADNITVPALDVIFAAFIYDGTSFVPFGSELTSRMDEAESDIDNLETELSTAEDNIDALEGSEVQSPNYADPLAVTIDKKETFLQPAELTGNTTINLTVDGDVAAGAKLHLKLDADDQGNKTVTLGTGFDASLASVVVISDTVWCLSFVYDGTAFIPMWSAPAS